MTRRKLLLAFAALFLWAFYALLTGGVVVYKIETFDAQRDVALPGLSSQVRLTTPLSKMDIPFLCRFRTSRAPHFIELQAWDYEKEFIAIEVNEVEAQYSDGERFTVEPEWSRQLEPAVQANSTSSGVVRTELLTVRATFEEIPLRHADVTIRLSGYMITNDGQRVGFNVWEQFKARHVSRWETFWSELASC